MNGDFVAEGFQLPRIKFDINNRWRVEKRKDVSKESIWTVCYSIII